MRYKVKIYNSPPETIFKIYSQEVLDSMIRDDEFGLLMYPDFYDKPETIKSTKDTNFLEFEICISENSMKISLRLPFLRITEEDINTEVSLAGESPNDREAFFMSLPDGHFFSTEHAYDIYNALFGLAVSLYPEQIVFRNVISQPLAGMSLEGHPSITGKEKVQVTHQGIDIYALDYDEYPFVSLKIQTEPDSFYDDLYSILKASQILIEIMGKFTNENNEEINLKKEIYSYLVGACQLREETIFKIYYDLGWDTGISDELNKPL